MSVREIQQATLRARERTGDNSIAVRVRKGLGQVVGVKYEANRTSRVREISTWVPLADLPAELDKVAPCAS